MQMFGANSMAQMSKPQRNLRSTLTFLISQCNNMNQLREIQAQIMTSHHLPQHRRDFLLSRLVFFCAISQRGSLSYASALFHFVPNPNLCAYNAMIRAYATRQKGSCNAFYLFRQMLREQIRPDVISIPFVLKECSEMKDDVGSGQSVHGLAIRIGLDDDVYVANSLIDFYSLKGILTEARRMFDEMLDRDVVSWNLIINGCLRNGMIDEGLELFRRMDGRGNIISWNSIITGLVQGGRGKEALELFHEMQSAKGDATVRPDKITIANIISACALLGAIEQGKWVHSYLMRSDLEVDMVIRTALVDMYGKCGSVETAIQVFKEMPFRDVLAWTTMISVLALHGFGAEALDILDQMVDSGVKPNQVTFVALLSACAHSGLVEKGRWCFDIMRRQYSIEPQVHHYACMVDLLSRVGLLEEAEGLIKSMPVEPDVFVWGALLGGCQLHKNVEIGARVASCLIDMEPLNHAFYMNLCDIYAKANRFDDLRQIRALMEERGVKKEVPGSSMVEVNGAICEFSVGVSHCTLIKNLTWVLNSLYTEIKVEGNAAQFTLECH